MGLASALNAHTTMGLQWASISGTGDHHLLGQPPAHLALPLRTHFRSTSTISLARRRNRSPATITSSPPKNKNKRLEKDEDGIEDIDDDALEALFSQLEEDLKNDDSGLLDELAQELSEEDLEKLNQEIAEMDEEISKVFDMTGFESEEEFEDEDETLEETNDHDVDDDDEDEEQPIQLKNWQLRRLALALKNGRRKTNIKNLAAELCIDRSIVLDLLRNPPPSLMMLSAALPDDEPSSPIITVPVTQTIETVAETIPEPEATPKPNTAVKVPVHVMQERFSSQKRIKKVHIQTLENVYARSKRPTNSMIQSIVDVTNLPRKRVLKWFEDKRAEEGVPEKRSVYQRSVSDAH